MALNFLSFILLLSFGGIRGLSELKRVNRAEKAVADEGMPPKSTWFEAKLADGLVSHVLA